MLNLTYAITTLNALAPVGRQVGSGRLSGTGGAWHHAAGDGVSALDGPGKQVGPLVEAGRGLAGGRRRCGDRLGL
jgi:hypothetical protein